MKSITLVLAVLVAYFGLETNRVAWAQSMKWVDVKEIYAKGKHNACPDLCSWNGRYYVVFAGHGEGHAETHGVVMLSSADGETWDTVFDEPQQHWKVRDDESYSAMTSFFCTDSGSLVRCFLESCQ